MRVLGIILTLSIFFFLMIKWFQLLKEQETKLEESDTTIEQAALIGADVLLGACEGLTGAHFEACQDQYLIDNYIYLSE